MTIGDVYTIVSEGQTGWRSPAVGEQTVRLLGPFTINYDDAGLGVDGVKVADLVAGTVVFAVGVIVTTAWNNGPQTFNVNLGGPDYGPPDDDYGSLTPNLLPSQLATSGNGFRVQTPFDMLDGDGVTTRSFWSGTFGVVNDAAVGALVVYCANTAAATQGSAKVYVLIAEPA